MGELLRQYGPPVLAWLLFLSRRRREDGPRRSVRWVLLGFAVSLTVLTPAVYSAGAAVGAPDLARLVGHAAMLVVVWAGLEFMAQMNGSPRGPRWHAWWIAGWFAVMCVLFALAPDLLPQSPWILEYCVVYLVAQGPGLVRIAGLCLRYAGMAGDAALRWGLRMIAAGAVGSGLYLVHKVLRTAISRIDFAYPLSHAAVTGKVLPTASTVLVLLGAAIPAAVGWLRRYRLFRQLGPLWTALYRADPGIALDPPTLPDVLVLGRLRPRLYRRVIEIRDGLLALQPHRKPGVAADAREQAEVAGFEGEQLEAVVEAVAVASALRSRAEGDAPGTPEAPVAGGGNLDSDTAFLSRVSLAYRRYEAAPRCAGVRAGRSR
ncbi:MAB_1171c family putative transporter [Umezawaea sp. Da 62-37]|uniref:MAB_1171c family putative transporter n=1 Tax=Umezawaea sp. Da 62-37 TaxID=3075927 RepID=UPI0028F6D077|nr:MAB_1171c family putative transporter [Umezawaea sp. Da 62-37]WNV87271.1 MAB_1171c family putative transporter [Umezawaea sp. Da 62-37]